MEPGVYQNIPFPDYLQVEAINASMLKAHAISPRHARWKAAEDGDTDALSLGRVVHAAVLEPDRYQAEFVVAPKFDRRTKVGKQGHADFCASAAGKTVVRAEEDRIACAIAAETKRLPHIADLVWNGVGDREVTVIQRDVNHGLLCKSRPDIVTEWRGQDAIVDIKTTSAKDLRWNTMQREVHKWGYHIQAAWYLDMYERATGINCETFVLVFCQTGNEMDVAAYVLDEDAIEQGRRECHKYLQQIVDCRESGLWPGVQPDVVQTIGLPAYAIESNIEPLALSIGGQEVNL